MMMIMMAAAAAVATPAVQPSARMCPASQGDLSFDLHEIMTSAGFYERDRGWERPITGDVGNDILFGPDRSLLVNFDRFYLSDHSTVVTAKVEIANPRGSAPVNSKEMLAVFQSALDQLAAIIPCK